MVAAKGCERMREKKKLNYVLTVEQQRSSGTHFPQERPHSL
jgi:hypothetical protein